MNKNTKQYLVAPKWKLLSILLCFAILTSTTKVALADMQPNMSGTKCVVASRGLNLRSGPGTYHWKKGVLPFGTKVSLISTTGSWSRVRYGTQVGWMYSKYLGGCTSRLRCDTNYSGYCVPLVSYDLDCKDVGKNFKVVGYDRHRFDGDGDGWACEGYRPSASNTSNTTLQISRQSSQSSCDSNYSGYCVPIVHYDLDCRDVGSNFRVTGWDKHRFDGDGDGWACES